MKKTSRPISPKSRRQPFISVQHSYEYAFKLPVYKAKQLRTQAKTLGVSDLDLIKRLVYDGLETIQQSLPPIPRYSSVTLRQPPE